MTGVAYRQVGDARAMGALTFRRVQGTPYEMPRRDGKAMTLQFPA
jgi:hypothetical protein